MSKADTEALQCAIDQIGAGLDSLMDLVSAIEAMAKRKPAQRKNPPKKKVAKT